MNGSESPSNVNETKRNTAYNRTLGESTVLEPNVRVLDPDEKNVDPLEKYGKDKAIVAAITSSIRYDFNRNKTKEGKLKTEKPGKEFLCEQKVVVEIPGCENIIKITDYSPFGFHKIRSLLGIDDFDYASSWSNPRQEIETDQLFNDAGEYFTKIISEAEANTLRNVLFPYYQHLKSNPYSLLTRYLGLFRISCCKQKKTYYSVERLQTDFVNYNRMNLFYLLNGVRRKATTKSNRDPLLDGNFKGFFDIDICVKKQIRDAVLIDTKFLTANNLTNYHLQCFAFVLSRDTKLDEKDGKVYSTSTPTSKSITPSLIPPSKPMLSTLTPPTSKPILSTLTPPTSKPIPPTKPIPSSLTPPTSKPIPPSKPLPPPTMISPSNPFTPSTMISPSNPFTPSTTMSPSNPLSPPTMISPSNPFTPPTMISSSNPYTPPTMISPSNPLPPPTMISSSNPYTPPTMISPSNPFTPPTMISSSNPFTPSTMISPSNPLPPPTMISPSNPLPPPTMISPSNPLPTSTMIASTLTPTSKSPATIKSCFVRKSETDKLNKMNKKAAFIYDPVSKSKDLEEKLPNDNSEQMLYGQSERGEIQRKYVLTDQNGTVLSFSIVDFLHETEQQKEKEAYAKTFQDGVNTYFRNDVNKKKLKVKKYTELEKK